MYNLHSIEDWFVCAMCISKQNQINHKTIEIRCLVFWFLFFRLCKWMKPFGDTTSIDRTAIKNAFWNDGIHSVNHLEQQFLFVVYSTSICRKCFWNIEYEFMSIGSDWPWTDRNCVCENLVFVINFTRQNRLNQFRMEMFEHWQNMPEISNIQTHQFWNQLTPVHVFAILN